ELEDQLPFLARRPLLSEPRGLPRGSGKIHVAETPAPSFCDNASLPWRAEIAQLSTRAGVGYHRSERHLENQVLGRAAAAIAAHPMLTALGAVMLLVAVVEQRGELRVGHQHHRGPVAAVSAARAAALDELLSPERHRAIAAVACFDG